MNLLPRTTGGIVAFTLRVLLGGLFVYSGWIKSRDTIGFLEDVRTFQILDDPYAAWLAMGLPWLEILAGAALITGVFLEGGLVLIAGMLTVFIGVLGYSWRRGLDINCGCFGKGTPATSYPEHILHNSMMLAVAAGLLVFQATQRRASRLEPKSPN